MPGPFSLANVFGKTRPSTATGAEVVPNPPAVAAGNQQKTASSVPGSNGMPNQATNPGADPANVTGNNTASVQATEGQTVSPLDAFTDVFKIDDKKQQQTNPLAEKLFNLDSGKLGAAVSKMNFAGSVSPELVAKALGGDHASFTAALNLAAQSAFAMSTNLVTQLMEQAITKNNSRFDSMFDGKIRDSMLNFQRPENPVLSHPAAQPVLAAMKKQIASQFPELSPSEVTAKAEGYFTAMSEALGSGKKLGAKGGEESSGEVDWSAFLSDSGLGQAQH